MGRLSFKLSILAAAFTTSLPFATAIVSSSYIGSDITLLYANDLNVHIAPERHSILVLSTPQSISEAQASCAALGETLLQLNESFVSVELPALLQYQVYIGAAQEDEQYWLDGSGNECQTVSGFGQLNPSESCDSQHPVLCSQSAAFNATAESPYLITVKSNGLQFTGFRDQLSFRFYGIPYANPPERFQYPTPYSGSSNVNATDFGLACMQSDMPNNRSGEDCLFLNIWTPHLPEEPSSSTQLKPVFFWIHGGAFLNGLGSDPTFAGGNMASRGDVVVVTINYRLSTLGYLVLDDGETSGNFGIADQVAALDWVQEHIAAFGGDPARVTIAGQSAGAASVRTLLQSPKAAGKFAGAIPMSSPLGSVTSAVDTTYLTIPQAVSQITTLILEETGCNGTDSEALACLTAYDAFALVNLSTVANVVVQDGTYVLYPDLPFSVPGAIANVHTMMGYMRDDGAAFITYPNTSNLTTALIDQDLPTTAVDNSLFQLPTGSNATLNVFNITALVSTDLQMRCLDQATAWSAIKHNSFQSLYFYQFNRSRQLNFWPEMSICNAPVTPDFPYGDPSLEYWKCHSGELYTVFGTLPVDMPYRDDHDLPFMQLTLDMWTAFVRTYDPNPDYAYLATRRYWASAAQLARDGPWQAVTNATLEDAPLRTLQWESFQGPFVEQPQCDFFGFPVDFFG